MKLDGMGVMWVDITPLSQADLFDKWKISKNTTGHQPWFYEGINALLAQQALPEKFRFDELTLPQYAILFFTLLNANIRRVNLANIDYQNLQGLESFTAQYSFDNINFYVVFECAKMSVCFNSNGEPSRITRSVRVDHVNEFLSQDDVGLLVKDAKGAKINPLDVAENSSILPALYCVDSDGKDIFLGYVRREQNKLILHRNIYDGERKSSIVKNVGEITCSDKRFGEINQHPGHFFYCRVEAHSDFRTAPVCIAPN